MIVTRTAASAAVSLERLEPDSVVVFAKAEGSLEELVERVLGLDEVLERTEQDGVVDGGIGGGEARKLRL